MRQVRSIYTGRPKDFITAVDEKNVIVVREVKDNETYDDLCKAAKVIYEMLCGENLPKARIALGTDRVGDQGCIKILQGSQNGTGCR